MSDDERKIRQLVTRIDTAVGLLAKIHDELLGIKRSLEGVNPVGEVMQHFAQLWRGRYGVPSSPSSASPGASDYVWNRSVDPAHIKRLLKVMDESTLKGRISRYFADSDPFLTKNKHPFNLFISRLNTYVPPANRAADQADDVPAPVIGCKHVPPCGTDAEHTRRRMGDLHR